MRLRQLIRRWRLLLTADCLLLILFLATLRVAHAPQIWQLGAGVLLLAAFGWLAIVWFRGAVAIALLELAVAGAGGQWAVFPGGLTGRMLIDGIVIGGAIGALIGAHRRTGQWHLGRYGLHAIVIALLLPGVWMTLGLLNGNRPSDVVGDGNGQFAFLLTLPLLVMIRDGQAEWVRRWILIACAANATVTAALIAISVPGFVSVWPTLNHILLEDLGMGGAVGYMGNGAYRLYLGSGLYLQLGLALVTWHLIQRRSPGIWPWALFALFWADVVATYTRGFWLGATFAVGAVIALAATNFRRPAEILSATVGLFAIGSVVGAAFGFSLPDYVVGRLSAGINLPIFDPSNAPIDVPPPTAPLPQAFNFAVGPETAIVVAWLVVAFVVARALSREAGGRDEGRRIVTWVGAAGLALALVTLTAALPDPATADDPAATPAPTAAGTQPQDAIADQIRATQLRVLLQQISAEPMIGHGFGAVAPDYPYSDSYSYELGFLDLAYKTGIVGLLLFLSYPLRLVFDALRVRYGWGAVAPGLVPRGTAPVVAVTLATLLTGATNPYVLAAFGLAPILIGIAWLEPERTPVLAVADGRLTNGAAGEPRQC